MMKRVLSTIAVASFAIASFAGGLLTNTNQSASFVRNPARYASLETDAIYFNPAGSAFFNEGWSLSGNWQMIWQQRDVENGGKTYEGKVYVPCMPTFFAAYKTGDWTFSGFFGMPGGGGNAQFENGLPMFNTLGAGFLAGTPLQAVSNFESTQYLFALQLGAAYQINEYFSVYGGIRANYTSLSYEGAIDAIHPVTGATMTNLLSLELQQTGLAFAPILGVNAKLDKLNIGVKYEFRAVNTIKNDTETLSSQGKSLIGLVGLAMPSLASLDDKQEFRNDAPAKLSIGASYDICDRVKVMGASVYYFDKEAKIESLIGKENTMEKLTNNTYELLAGIEVKVTNKLLLSSGIQFSDFGVNPSYLSDVSFIDDSFMVGFGGKYSLNEKCDLNFGACYANYAHGKGATGSTYLRKTYNVAVGVDFRL